MRTFLIVLFCFITSSLFSQETWITTIATSLTERIFDIRKTPVGNYIACGKREEVGGNLMFGFLAEIDQEGVIINEKDFIINDSASCFGYIIFVSDTSFVVLGSIGADDQFLTDMWLLHFNYEFDIVKHKKISCFPGRSYIETRPKLISNGNFLIHGFVNDSLDYSDMFFYEISVEGDSITSSLIEIPSHQFTHDFIENKDNSGYISFAMGWFPEDPPGLEVLLRYDSAFNLISIDSVPRQMWDLMNAKWLTDDTYILTGKKAFLDPHHLQMGILRLDTLNQIIHEGYFGLMADTSNYPGSSDNLDFRNPDTIFYCGTGNFVAYPWQNEPSWIIVNCLDSNLNLRWQTLYGGDAFYHSWEVYATSDGGCIVSASKFDYTQPELDYDVVLLKYDHNGLLTGINEPDENLLSMSVFPNPGGDVIKINNNFEDAVFQLFDESGKGILNTILDIGLNQLNVSSINPGIYVYMISIKEKPVSSGKWIKR